MADFQIWKYDVPITGEFSLPLPLGAKVLTVQVQAGDPVLWALVDPDMHRKARRFSVVGTGNPAEHIRAARYVGTFQLGRFVWHVFEHLGAGAVNVD